MVKCDTWNDYLERGLSCSRWRVRLVYLLLPLGTFAIGAWALILVGDQPYALLFFMVFVSVVLLCCLNTNSVCRGSIPSEMYRESTIKGCPLDLDPEDNNDPPTAAWMISCACARAL